MVILLNDGDNMEEVGTGTGHLPTSVCSKCKSVISTVWFAVMA